MESESDGGARHRNATQSTNLPQPKSEVAVSQSDFCHLETDPGRNTFPDHGHLGRECVTLSPQRKITEFIARRYGLVEVPLDMIKVEYQMKAIPTGERR